MWRFYFGTAVLSLLMALFMVVGLGDNASLAAKIMEQFPDNSLDLGSDKWLIVSPGTAKEISDKIGISDGASGTGIIANFTGYYGRASSNIWEWITAKTASPTNV